MIRRVRDFALFPFRLVWSLVRLLVGPVVALALAWLVFRDSAWFLAASGAVLLYLVIALSKWAMAVTGVYRGLARGPIYLSTDRDSNEGRS